ncbi:phage fiber-tail adaptor protein [Halomonas sp. hl-4]|uniref:phage fiber-tail adaptor protein n=1 Tax=Halomonas sp. hl-4 TaxID=1761789 RepID=UPI000BB6BBC1|nr:hypothetical protein [Halomonas sp. hl-4]SNY95572.1 hypothetical protein SAMN04488142_0073 [Halomonas sp. hl-4]
MAILGTFTMQPADEWDYDIDYSDWLPESDGLSESTPPEVVISPEGLTAESITRDYDNKRVKIWLLGGEDGQRYKVEVTTRSREGRVRQDEFYIIVRDF